jgi:hypothetical protein
MKQLFLCDEHATAIMLSLPFDFMMSNRDKRRKCVLCEKPRRVATMLVEGKGIRYEKEKDTKTKVKHERRTRRKQRMC